MANKRAKQLNEYYRDRNAKTIVMVMDTLAQKEDITALAESMRMSVQGYLRHYMFPVLEEMVVLHAQEKGIKLKGFKGK
jgi:hypothetical protein